MTDSKAPALGSQHLDDHAQPEQVADNYADRLMDELFDGVERALAGDAEALDAIPKPDIAEQSDVSELTLSFTEGGLPAVLLDSGQAELSFVGQPNLSAVAADATETPVPTAKTKRWQDFWTLNRALLGAAGLTLLATLGVWLHQRQQVPVAATSPTSMPTDAPIADLNAEFLEYLRRSLEVIAQNASESTTTATTSVADIPVALNNGNVGLPPVGNTVLPSQVANGMTATPGSINVIERVYIPYPSATANYPTAQGAPDQVGSTPSAASVASAVPVVTHTLVGVLELGENSAALFEIDGVTQRVYIGERIGNSGWSLVSVANEEAIVRRNGEVRTLYIGQRF